MRVYRWSGPTFCVNDLTAAFKKSPYGVSLLILINPMEIDYDLHTACNYILGLIYSLWREAGIYNVDKVEHCCNEHVERLHEEGGWWWYYRAGWDLLVSYLEEKVRERLGPIFSSCYSFVSLIWHDMKWLFDIPWWV